MHSAYFNCLFMLFYLLRLIILETNLSACLQMAELRIILILTHTHWLQTYLFFLPLYIFYSYFNNRSSIQASKLPHMWMYMFPVYCLLYRVGYLI